MTVAEALREAAARLAESSETPRLDAEHLMAHALGVSRSEMLLRHSPEPTPSEFDALVARRVGGEPLAYVLGTAEFYGLTLRVTPDVLIPRRDSEVLVDAALKDARDGLSVLDLGTGSGALLLAALAHVPRAQGVGIDSSPAALAVAQDNAARLDLASRARFVEADWTEAGWQEALDPPYDLILANPPYVEDDAPLASSVRDHEPAPALFAGPEGLDDYRVLIPQLPALLARNGAAYVEIGAAQAEAVSAIARKAGLSAQVILDIEKRPRVLRLLWED